LKCTDNLNIVWVQRIGCFSSSSALYELGDLVWNVFIGH
jgi:hypothetical protein